MQSKAQTVDKYFQEVPAERLEALKNLRALCTKNLKGYTESMTYGMPSYGRNDVVEVAFNSQKNYIALYILKKEVLDAYRDQFKDVGKGCIRYKKPEDIDFTIVEKLLKGTVRSVSKGC